MGLGDPGLLEDGGGGGGGGMVGAAISGGASAHVSCSICLDSVMNDGDRSTARLQCGHQFHLDCIGSAFNVKGVMQCPNCRQIEKGNWLYANGYRPIPELSMDDWMHDDDFYDVTYSEMPPFGVHFCPFNRLARFPFSYEDNVSDYLSVPTRFGDNDLFGHPALFNEYPGISLYRHLFPYMGHVHQAPLSSSSGSQVSTESVMDGLNFHHHWNSTPVPPIDISNAHPFPAVDPLHQNWDSHSQSNNHLTGEQPLGSSPPARAGRLGSDAHLRQQMYIRSFGAGQGSGSRASNSAAATPMIPHYMPNSQGHGRHENHGTYVPNVRGAPFGGGAQRFSGGGGTRGLGPVGPTPPSEHPGFYFFSPVAASNRTQETEGNGGGSNLYAWERDRLAPFPLLPVDRDLPWWGPLPQQTSTAPPDSGSRTGFWTPRHSSERPSSQAAPQPTPHHPPPHHPRLHPFI